MCGALDAGELPFTRSLIESEGYRSLPYRCGIPSTTPFAQAGILYGDNREIPSFRWYDKREGRVIAFGAGSTFKHVADRYFRGSRPLCEGGACVAACYPAGAAETFGLTYRDRTGGRVQGAGQVARAYLASPGHVADFVLHGLRAAARSGYEYVRSRAAGRRPAAPYVVSDALEEMLLHHVTRFAVGRAMKQGYPAIYGAFYAYDETGHGFGPEDRYPRRMLRHLDHTVREIAGHRRFGPGYELIVLSDHGQVPTVAFDRRDGVRLGELVHRQLPRYRVREEKGGRWEPDGEPQGEVVLAYSGGLAHLYLTEPRHRLSVSDLEGAAPGLLGYLAGLDDIEFIIARDHGGDVFVDGSGSRPLAAAADVLGRFDDAGILEAQLSRLNSFEASGDLILFGRWHQGFQVNFENQAGGHGSIGGEQCHPFVLAREAIGLETAHVTGAHQLHEQLMRLRPPPG